MLTVMMNRLRNLDGDWHEFESKALRKENERVRRAAEKEKTRDKDKKRTNEVLTDPRDAKRLHLDKGTLKEKELEGAGNRQVVDDAALKPKIVQ